MQDTLNIGRSPTAPGIWKCHRQAPRPPNSSFQGIPVDTSGVTCGEFLATTDFLNRLTTSGPFLVSYLVHFQPHKELSHQINDFWFISGTTSGTLPALGLGAGAGAWGWG